MKLYLLIVGWIILISIFPTKIYAENQSVPVLIVNQIRGNEACCQPGSPEMIEKINQNENLKQLSLSWAVRFDALNDEIFLDNFKKIPQNQNLGILLEITPDLASKSGVLYKGNSDGSDWHTARNVFLVGYSLDERKKLIDTVFNAFYEKFKFYPSFTVSWMIDSWSLNYIRNNYNVKVHEITKEQYETDSYTLYGGIFNLPYFPNRFHPLLPAVNTDNALDLLIIRQTISDIEKNYGSAKSDFTSQPNDYLGSKLNLDFSYFNHLFEQTIVQSENNRFMVLGLENSLIWQKYQDEYLKQLNFLYENQQNNIIKTYSPNDYYNLFKNINPETQILKSQDFPQKGVLWYFGKNYRARMEIWKEKLVLTDFRIFSQFTDPYAQEAAKTDRAYFVLPYLIDSSQEFEEINKSDLEFAGNQVRSDDKILRLGLELSSFPINTVQINGNIVTLTNQSEEIKLEPEAIFLKNSQPIFTHPININLNKILELNTDWYFSLLFHPRFFISPDKDKQNLLLGWENKNLEKINLAEITKKDNIWQIHPNINLNQTQIESLSVIFMPDKSDYGFDPQSSTFYWNNKEAIAGKNPVRLYVDPRNIFMRPASISKLNILLDNPSTIEYKTDFQENNLSPFLIDFTASQSAKTNVIVNINNNAIGGETQIVFYPDCFRDIIYCIKNKDEFQGFLKVLFKNKKEEYIVKINNSLIKFKFELFNKIDKNQYFQKFTDFLKKEKIVN